MGNAKYRRALSVALLGLLIIGVGLVVDANAASSCTSEIQNSAEGAYQGCLVKMGNREFTVGAAQSSAEGCTQVCGIMAEMGANASAARKTANASNTVRE